MAPKPTLLFVHGSWHRPEHFDSFIDLLQTQHGYKCITIFLPSVEYTPGAEHRGVPEDTLAIRDAILGELSANEDADIVVVAHSYGGIPSMNALDGLDRTARTKAGYTNCVSAAALICALVLSAGQNLVDGLGGSHGRPIFDIDENGCTLVRDPVHHLYHDVPEAAAVERAVSLLRPQSLIASSGPVDCEGYRQVPTSYLFCSQDRAVPIDVQKRMVGALEAELRTEEIEAAHSPFLSVPARVVEFIERSTG